MKAAEILERHSGIVLRQDFEKMPISEMAREVIMAQWETALQMAQLKELLQKKFGL